MIEDATGKDNCNAKTGPASGMSFIWNGCWQSFANILTTAFTAPVSSLRIFRTTGGVQPPGNAFVINFCDSFFRVETMEGQLDKLQTSTNLVQTQKDICDLSKLDSTARVMLHEMTQCVGPSPFVVMR